METSKRTNRRAVTAVEVMVSMVVLGVALVPALGSSISVGRQTGFTRAHALAHVHAASRLEETAAHGFHALVKASAAGVPLSAPAIDARALPFEIAAEEIEFRTLQPSLGVLTVKLAWRQPGEPLKRVTVFRMLSPADDSWTIANPLPAPTPETTPAD